MRNNVYLLLCLVVLAASIGLNIFLFYSYNRVQSQFEDQTEIIKKYDEIDRRLRGGENDLLTTLEKFLNDEAYTVKGKTVSTGDFLLYHNRSLDSLQLYKDFYEYCQDNYGVNLRKIKPTDSTYRIVSDPPTKADTASLLVPYYKKFVYKEKGTWWTITTDYEALYNETLQQLRDLEKENIKNLKSAVDGLQKANKEVERYQNMLKDLEKEGVVKLDTVSKK